RQRHLGDRATSKSAGRDRRRQRFQGFFGSVYLIGIADSNLDHPARAVKARIADLGVAQQGTNFIADGVKPLLDEVILLDLEQDVRAALQVEAKGHLLFRQPVRHAGENGLRKKIGGCEQKPEQYDCPNPYRLPARKVKHGYGPFRLECGYFLAAISWRSGSPPAHPEPGHRRSWPAGPSPWCRRPDRSPARCHRSPW